MTAQEDLAMWTVSEPSGPPPSFPEQMSFTRLHEIEECPARWSLGAAAYPSIWSRAGYPKRLNKGNLRGQVIHKAAETVVSALTRNGCPAVHHEAFSATMRELGGYSRVVNAAIGEILDEYRSNPRFQRNGEALDRWIHEQGPDLRQRVQQLVSRIRLQPKTNEAVDMDVTCKDERSSLGIGSFTEVELRVEEIHWFGFADLINVSETGCEIVDFKTGRHDPDHADQLRVYALLWARDAARNPDQVPVNRLTLSYPGEECDVHPPSPAELQDLAAELAKRTDDAARATSHWPAPAIPSVEHCRFCPVRQLCPSYWQPSTLKRLTLEASASDEIDRSMVDVEADVTKRLGERLWEAVICSSGVLADGTKVTLRTMPADRIAEAVLRSSKRVRIIGAFLEAATEEGPQQPGVSLSLQSEVFRLQ